MQSLIMGRLVVQSLIMLLLWLLTLLTPKDPWTQVECIKNRGMNVIIKIQWKILEREIKKWKIEYRIIVGID